MHVLNSTLPIICMLLSVCAGHGQAVVTPNGLFTDHAVLQQGVEIPVWGTADDGEAITVHLADQSATTVAAGGRWMVRLKPLAAGGPHVLTINTLTLRDILIGEVWLCSGQSNMERQLGPRQGQPLIDHWEQEAATADLPQIRHFRVARAEADEPLHTVTGTWTVCSPTTVADFTAVGFFFARALQQSRHVPIGLLHSSLGGTRVQQWTSREALAANPATTGIFDAWKLACTDYPARLAQWKQDQPRMLATYEEAAAAAQKAGTPPPHKPGPPKDPAKNPPARLFNGMLAPLIPYALRGVLWYQGESDNVQARFYRDLFPNMIADWRQRWGVGNFPFLFVQITPNNEMTPELREAQLLTLTRSPNTAMVVTTDAGMATNVHSPFKRPVGERLALAARALAYGETVEYSGPLYRSLRIEGAKAVVDFTHADSGLMAKDGPLTGFAIAGTDKIFVPAQAAIRANAVEVWSDAVAVPVAVRYGWANVPTVNLYNQVGLPASPFRTDVE